jgi:hypothetical protein
MGGGADMAGVAAQAGAVGAITIGTGIAVTATGIVATGAAVIEVIVAVRTAASSVAGETAIAGHVQTVGASMAGLAVAETA